MAVAMTASPRTPSHSPKPLFEVRMMLPPRSAPRSARRGPAARDSLGSVQLPELLQRSLAALGTPERASPERGGRPGVNFGRR
jgi:hypothetical protein